MVPNSMEGIESGAGCKPSKRRRNILVFAAVALSWILLDIVTKQYFDGAYQPGDVITDPILGLFRFHLVHNTGAAWGMFDQSTGALAIMSTIVCSLIIGYFALLSKQGNIGEVLGLALVFAGGVGNAIDRISIGYVVDFIEFTFIDFPIFNIADIGVTCGIVLFILCMLISWANEDRLRKKAEEQGSEVLGEGSGDADAAGEDGTGRGCSVPDPDQSLVCKDSKDSMVRPGPRGGDPQ